MSARTARRRRSQAVQGYNHLARIGRGNNNRPIIRIKSATKQQRREAMVREKLKLIALRKGMSKK